MPLSARWVRRRRVRARAVGFPRRLAASLIDALLPSAAAVLLAQVGLVRLPALHRHADMLAIDSALRVLYEDPRALLAVPLAWMLLWTALALVQLGALGTTLGKRLLGLRLRQRNGRVAGAGHLLARVAASWLVPLTLGLAYIWMLVNPDRRGWHDLCSGTFVVRDDPVG